MKRISDEDRSAVNGGVRFGLVIVGIITLIGLLQVRHEDAKPKFRATPPTLIEFPTPRPEPESSLIYRI